MECPFKECRHGHGSPCDRGSADAYYGRSRDPHYFEGNTYSSRRISEGEMSPDELDAYNWGYDNETDRKVWD